MQERPCRSVFPTDGRALLLIALLSFCHHLTGEIQPPKMDHLREGDLVVRYTDSLLSRTAVTFSSEDRRFSHVGILWRNPSGRWFVIHALPRKDGLPEVFAETLEDFLKPAVRHGYFRWKKSTEEAQQLAIQAVTMTEQPTLPFDRSFDLERTDAVYCTELIWRIAKEVWGRDIVPEKSLFRGRAIISMENLIKSPYLEEVL